MTLDQDARDSTLRLPYRPPYNWPMLLDFLTNRVIPGVEWVVGERYVRSFVLHGHAGWVEVRHDPANLQLVATVHTPVMRIVPDVAGRLRRLFDLDTDVVPIETVLSADPLFTDKVRRHPGLRMPGAWDEFELAVRAILGQQVSVAAACTLARRLVAKYGQSLPPTADWPLPEAPWTFPAAADLADQDLTHIGLPRARAEALAGLAAAVAANNELLSPHQNPRQAVANLVKLRGVGPWTAEYIAMRGLRDADAFPASDLGLLQGAANGGPRPTPTQLTKQAEQWRPWRAYAAIHLWTMNSPPL